MFQRCVCRRALELLEAPVQTFCCQLCRRCFTDGQFQQAIGIAVESRRLDKLKQAIVGSEDVTGHLMYAIKVAQTLVTSRHYRQEVRTLALTTRSSRTLASPRWWSTEQLTKETLSALVARAPSQVLRVLVDMLLQSKEVDYVLVCQCLMFLNEPTEVASVLEKLISGSEVILGDVYCCSASAHARAGRFCGATKRGS